MSTRYPTAIRVIDSHTEGEPTRVIIDGFPALAAADMRGRAAELAACWDHLRSAVVREPRGHDAVVGALLTPPVTPGAAAGVIFFNNVGLLGMCGHGLIGVARTLRELGRAAPGMIHVDTPVGAVSALIEGDAVTIRNVPARATQLDVSVELRGAGRVLGDVAWGGNWFFLTEHAPVPLQLENAQALTHFTHEIMRSLRSQGITGDGGSEIDHVEITVPSRQPGIDARNFVLCPGGAYDRSPCGTGTSAKLAVLHARGQLAPGARWCQESITGGRFTAWFGLDGDDLVPFIRGRAFITAESVLRFDAADPFRAGFGGSAP